MKTIALVGCGRISRRHIEAIQATEGVEIAAVCDILPERARKCAEELSVPWTTDFRKLPPVDFAAVLTPSGNHPEHAAAIAESTGVGGILCEKPISLTMREAYHLFSRIDRTGKRLLPIYQNRYNPLVILLKELVDSGRLGKLYQFICNVLWNRDNDYFSIDWHGTREFDGGVLYTQASHYVDLLHYLFGEIAESKGIGGCRRNLEVFDAVSATMRFRNGIVGSLNATVDVFEKNYQTEFTLIAENGTIRLSGTNLNRIDFWNVRDLARPDMDFTLDHIYGKGHDQLYRYLAEERWEMFPSREDVLSGIRLMEMLSY